MRLALALLLAVACSPAQVELGQVSPQDSVASAKFFVQEFYTWYLLPGIESRGPKWYRVLNDRESALSDELTFWLRADSAAQATSGEVTALNFDPFLSSQDPCPRYEVGEVRARARNYEAAVFAVCAGAKPAVPTVTTEVARNGSTWKFVNIYYGTTDLRKLLCEDAATGFVGAGSSQRLGC
jgi:hypothetical protein